MVKKIAIDWDENELRLVAAQCSGSSIKVTDAAVIPIEKDGIIETLRAAISRRALESTETLIAIGRGKAELRELQLPPVPDDELPDMVRFQAIRSFASAGDRATVDYLVTNRTESGVEMIAAAVGPDSLTEIHEVCESSQLSIKRIGLRPLAAAALYLARRDQNETGDIVLIDLLSDDAEIVIARAGHVIFVRTVRMPSGVAARPKALAGELRRSLVACGSTGSLNRVVLWGLESVHQEDVVMLTEAAGTDVVVLDPFELVDVDRKMRNDLPEHVGRLAPLVGLIASDELHADRLIDFLNPRKRVELAANPLKRVLMIGLPIAAALLLAFFAYRHLKQLDSKIALLQSTNAELQPDVERAVEWVSRTEKVDQFLDSDVNWLEEIRRLAEIMPPSDQMILTSLVVNSDVRKGGGTMTITGAVTDPNVMKDFEETLRDDGHRVVGDESTERKTNDAYKWTIAESITVLPESIRNSRYEKLASVSDEAETKTPAAEPEEADDSPSDDSPSDDSPSDDSPSDDSPSDDSPPDDSPPDDSPPDDSPPDDSPPDDSPPTETPLDADNQPSVTAEPVSPADSAIPTDPQAAPDVDDTDDAKEDGDSESKDDAEQPVTQPEELVEKADPEVQS